MENNSGIPDFKELSILEKTMLNFKDQNFISIRNLNAKFNTSILYNQNTKEFFILLINDDIICGEKYTTAKSVYDWICRNIDRSGLDYNIKFNYNVATTPVETKGRLFYALEKEDCLKELLLMLI